MKNYKGLLNTSQLKIDETKLLLAKFKQASQKAEKPSVFYAANKQEQIKKLEKELEENSVERLKSVLGFVANSKTQLDEFKSSQLKDAKSDLRTYHSQKASRALSRGSVEDAINTYKRLVGNLSAGEKQYRAEYDAELLERAAFEDPASIYASERAVDNFRNPEEKTAIRELTLAGNMFKHHKTADALIKQQVDNLRESDDCTTYDWEKIYSEMLQTASDKSIEPIELKVNPYDSDTPPADE